MLLEVLFDEALDLDSLAAVAAELFALPQAANERTSKVESANDTTFFIVFSFFLFVRAIIHQKHFDLFILGIFIANLSGLHK